MIASKLSIMFIISSGRARGGSAVIIKQDIKHNAHHCRHLRTSRCHAMHDNITIVAVYCPMKHNSTLTFSNLVETIILNTIYGSKTHSPQGKVLEKTIRKLSLDTMATGEPTYILAISTRKNTRSVRLRGNQRTTQN